MEMIDDNGAEMPDEAESQVVVPCPRAVEVRLITVEVVLLLQMIQCFPFSLIQSLCNVCVM